ncbi:MAG: lactoylglutathione lyase [Burkholderiales bacterium]|nr:lactoylglutathione lyase [Burkholderiales bacterium]
MKFLHTMIRVGDLEKSINFYTNALGMTLIKKNEYPDGKFTLAFMGYSKDGPQIELTYNWDTNKYNIGDGFGHIALAVDDINLACDTVIAAGGKVTRKPGPMKFGTTVIAFVEDPDGYKIELINN